jgi:hypothetical protein
VQDNPVLRKTALVVGDFMVGYVRRACANSLMRFCSHSLLNERPADQLGRRLVNEGFFLLSRKGEKEKRERRENGSGTATGLKESGPEKSNRVGGFLLPVVRDKGAIWRRFQRHR